MPSRTSILWLALFTLAVFPAVGLVTAYFWLDLLPYEVLQNREPWWLNTLVGLAVGTAGGFLAWGVIQMSFMKPVLKRYGNIIGAMQLEPWQIIYISICAGVGEEILFRGGLQPGLGIWITSVAFVALHGYLNPWNWRITVYGVVMTLLIAGLGWMTDELGLLSSILAHTMIDVVLLYKLTYSDDWTPPAPVNLKFRDTPFEEQDEDSESLEPLPSAE